MENLDSSSGAALDWEHLRPALDEAMSELSEPDYDTLVMRYFNNQDLRSVGVALGTSDDAAQKRVSRALDKLRDILSQRGITTSAATLSVVISANAVEAAPIGLAASISTTAALAGTSIAGTTIATATKAIAMTTVQKAFITAALAIVVATPLFLQNRALAKARSEQSGLVARFRDTQMQAPAPSSVGDTINEANRGRDELERLRREAATLRERMTELSAQAKRLGEAQPAGASPKTAGTPIGETLRLVDSRDAGQATPAALLQTHVWAMLHGDTNRLAQLMALSPETDRLRVQRMFEELRKDAVKGTNAILAETSLGAIRLLEEQPAENNDRWVVSEFVKKDGSVSQRSRIRVRPTVDGWKLVIGIDGQPEQENLNERP